jgi:cell division protein FtsB
MRWDRLGRAAMLFVLLVLVYLYISPVRGLISAVGESGRRQAEVAGLMRANAQLRAERAALVTPAARERAARSLGLVRPGERAFVISGLPSN